MCWPPINPLPANAVGITQLPSLIDNKPAPGVLGGQNLAVAAQNLFSKRCYTISSQ